MVNNVVVVVVVAAAAAAAAAVVVNFADKDPRLTAYYYEEVSKCARCACGGSRHRKLVSFRW